MNLGAGQPASLPYGIEPPLWYSNQYPYHSVQFSLSPQQWGLPFSSPIYHPPPPDYQPPPPGYHPPPLPNHYSAYAYHFSQPNYPPPQLTQPNSYPPPQNNHSTTLINGHWLPLRFPCVSQAHTQDYPCPHLQPTHTIPPHTTYEPPPPIAPGSQLCSLPLQLGGVSESEVSIVDSGRPYLNYPDAKLSEFIESMSKSFDTCISKCIERLQLFEGFSPTHKPKFQSSAPKISSPQLPQPTSKLSPLLDGAQSVNLLMPSLSTSRNKRVTLKSTAATGGVKKRRLFRPGTIVPRETGKYQRRNKPPFKSSVVPSTLENTVLAHWISSTVWAQSNNTPASSCSVSDTGTSNSDFNFVSIDCDSVDSMLFVKLNENENLENVEEGIFDKRIMVNNGDDYELGELKGIGVQQENQGPKSCVKGRESQTLHLFDEMPKSEDVRNDEVVKDAYSYPKKAGYNPHKIDFVPISGSEDETLIERYTNFDWYKATTLLETHPCDVGLNMNNLAVKDLKHGFVASNSQDDTTKNTTNFTSQIIIMNHPKLYSSKKEHSDGYDGNENDVKKDLESSQSSHFSGGTVVFSDMHDLEASLQSNVFSSKSFLVVKDLDFKESITIFNEQIIRPPDDIEVDDHKCAFYKIFFEFLIAFFECTIESGSSNKACGCQNVHVEKRFSTIVDGDVILGYTSEAFTGMVLRFNMESANEGKLQTTQRPATHPGIFDASHVSKKAFFELPDKGISGLVTSKLECKSSLESKDLHSNVATKPVTELDDVFMGHIFMLGCTRPPEDGDCWNLDGKTYSRVVRGFLDNRNATVLETLIIEARKLESPTIMVDILGCYGIINACIGTTLSDEAHVTFDEKNAQGIILGSYVHVPILKACSNEHKIAEATQMLMQISNSELKMDMDLALIREYVSEDKSLHVLLQWHKVKRNSLVDREKGLIFVDNMVDAFLYALVKGDRHLPLLLPYLIVFVMGEVSTSLELLQHEYHIDLVDLAAAIAIAFTQLHLSHEAADTYKDLNMMTGHKQDVGEYLTWTFMHSDQVLIMVLYYCHKTIGYWPFEDPDYPTTPWEGVVCWLLVIITVISLLTNFLLWVNKHS